MASVSHVSNGTGRNGTNGRSFDIHVQHTTQALLALGGQGAPRFYVKLLATLEDKLNEVKEKVRG